MTRLPELGDEIGPRQRQAPGPDEIRRYGTAEAGEGFFNDEQYARGLGFRGLVVPGPLLAAYVEQFLHEHFPDWRVEWLSTTFRLPSAAGDVLTLRGAITDKWHFAAAGRRSHLDWVLARFTSEDVGEFVPIPKYWDG